MHSTARHRDLRFLPVSLRLAGCLAAAAAPLAAASSGPLTVTAVQFWSSGDTTRIAVETNGPFRYRSDRLSNPDRLFFDLVGAKPAMVSKGQHVISVNSPLLHQIRVAETQPSVTRVVLDLAAPVELNAAQLASPDRLMIELRPAGGGSPPPSIAPAATGGQRLEPAARPFTPAPAGTQPKPGALPEAPALAARQPLRAAPYPTPSVPAPPAASSPAALSPTPTPAAAVAKLTPALPPAPKPSARPAPDAAPAAPAKRTSTGERSMTRVLGLKIRRVVIDPGHGGHDHGTTGPTGLTEKELVLDIAQKLGALLEERMGCEVLYTRTKDEFIALEERTAFANRHRADLFLSIHANSSPLKTATGAETYYLNFTTSRAALDVAARENAASEKSIHELRELLQKIALKDKLDESREFAVRLQAALHQALFPPAKGVRPPRDRGVKKAPFVVLIGASMPSVLAEIGFLSNPREELALKRPDHRQKIAEALHNGIAQYEAGLSHFLAQRKSAGAE